MLEIDYHKRLADVCERLDGATLLLFSQPEFLRNSTVEHWYRQDASFYYLTGFKEPESVLVVAAHRKKGERVFLFVREKNFNEELWTGRRLGIDAAKKHLSVDEVYPIADIWKKLPELLAGTQSLYFDLGYSTNNDRMVAECVRKHQRALGRKQSYRLSILDPQRILGPMRLLKKPEEIERMKRAAAASARTYTEVFKFVRPGVTETEVHGMLLGGFLQHGGEMESYGSIVASGENACILHYRDNDRVLKDGDLLLIDAGAQYDLYASDVTRTFPVGKKFSPAQKTAYEIVLQAQKNAIAMAKPGKTWLDVHNTAIETLVDGLLDLKLLSGSKSEILEKNIFKKFYPHGTSHWIGMDVHDFGAYMEDEKAVIFEPGMYFSVEPGLYFDPSYADVPAEFRGVGIRVEDDVLITKSGNEVLTAAIPKDIHALENRN